VHPSAVLAGAVNILESSFKRGIVESPEVTTNKQNDRFCRVATMSTVIGLGGGLDNPDVVADGHT